MKGAPGMPKPNDFGKPRALEKTTENFPQK